MLFYSSLDQVPDDFGPSAVSIGKFDGVHAGHRRVIDRLREIAKPAGLVSTVLTFDRHPLALLNPELCPISLTSNAQKRDILATTGLDAEVMIEFTREFSHRSPEDFIEHVLVGTLRAKYIFVGSDFRFGRQGRGSVAMLTELGREFGFEVETIAAVMPDNERPISSTWIRGMLSEGDIGEATHLLQRRPSVRGVVVHGEQRGRELGYPTANLAADLEGFIPADGVYAAYVVVDGRTIPAAVSVGNNPTFQGVAEKQVEAHLLDEDLDLYGKTLEVSFVEYIRGMEKFPGVAELIAQMTLDEVRVREILGVAPRRTPIAPVAR